MEQLLLVLVPFIVTGVTSLTKRIPVFDNLTGNGRIVTVRLIAAAFSFAGATAIYAIGGDPITETNINELVLAVMTFLAALGGHDILKKKDQSNTYIPL